MFSKILPVVFGAILWILCLCYCAELDISTKAENTVSNATSNSSNSVAAVATQETGNGDRGRCFGTMTTWFMNETGLMSGNPNDVRFFLYPNPQDRNYSEEIKFGDVPKLMLTHLTPDVKLKIIIHGFTRNYVSESVQLIKNAYLMRMDQIMRDGGNTPYNVILVDWEPLGKPKVGELEGLFYRLAVKNVPVVGRRVAEFIQFLIVNKAVKSLKKDVHIIGFSLGAHVAGHAGNTLKEFNAGQVPARVTGLDPAGPSFYDKISFSSRHLHKTDGRFVDVIHSNRGGLGTLSTLGHVDFFPNGGGPIQRHCEIEYEQQIQKLNRGTSYNPNRDPNAMGGGGGGQGIWDLKLLTLNSCSHNKGPQFFAMSILNPKMTACKCDDYRHFKSGCNCNQTAVFGEYCDKKTKGSYYLDI